MGPLAGIVFGTLCVCLFSDRSCKTCPLSGVMVIVAFTDRIFALPNEALCLIGLCGTGGSVHGEPVRGELVCGELVGRGLVDGEVMQGGGVVCGEDSNASEKMFESKPSTELCDEAVLPRLLWCKSDSVVLRLFTPVMFTVLTDLCLPLPQASNDMLPVDGWLEMVGETGAGVAEKLHIG